VVDDRGVDLQNHGATVFAPVQSLETVATLGLESATYVVDASVGVDGQLEHRSTDELVLLEAIDFAGSPIDIQDSLVVEVEDQDGIVS